MLWPCVGPRPTLPALVQEESARSPRTGRSDAAGEGRRAGLGDCAALGDGDVGSRVDAAELGGLEKGVEERCDLGAALGAQAVVVLAADDDTDEAATLPMAAMDTSELSPTRSGLANGTSAVPSSRTCEVERAVGTPRYPCALTAPSSPLGAVRVTLGRSE